MELNASCHSRPVVANMMPWTAALISANAAGPPQWQAAPPTTAWTSISATSARVARGSPSVTSAPAAFFTWAENLGAPLGVEASLDLSLSGASGGATTGWTTEVSTAIIQMVQFTGWLIAKLRSKNVSNDDQNARTK